MIVSLSRVPILYLTLHVYTWKYIDIFCIRRYKTREYVTMTWRGRSYRDSSLSLLSGSHSFLSAMNTPPAKFSSCWIYLEPGSWHDCNFFYRSATTFEYAIYRRVCWLKNLITWTVRNFTTFKFFLSVFFFYTYQSNWGDGTRRKWLSKQIESLANDKCFLVYQEGPKFPKRTMGKLTRWNDAGVRSTKWRLVQLKMADMRHYGQSVHNEQIGWVWHSKKMTTKWQLILISAKGRWWRARARRSW